jgi:hypothetical protein
MPPRCAPPIGAGRQPASVCHRFQPVGNGIGGAGSGGQSVLLAARHAPGSIASLFIQQDTGTLPIEDGRMYTVLAPADAAGPAASTGPAAAATAHLPEILVWRRDGLLYFLVCNSAIVREASLLALQPPEPGGTL